MKVLLPVFLLISCHCYGQRDYCKDIRQEEHRAEGSVSYHSPLVGKLGIVAITTTLEDTIASLSVYLGVFSESVVFNTGGLSLKLEDGTVLKDDRRKITCTMVDANQYNLSGVLDVADEDVEALSTSRIISITCGGITRDLSQKDGLLVLNYLKCLMDR